MAENHIDGRVIGIALDGTGYGTDGAIWGGEVLLADYVNFQRAAHLEYVALPGWRGRDSRALAHRGELPRETLRQASGRPEIPFVKDLDRRNLDILLQMIERGVNSPLTSSCGRLFDAVAALIGLRTTVNYEAQAAIELEMAAHESH